VPLPLIPPRSAAHPFDVAGLGESSLDFVAVVSDAIAPDAKLPLDRFEALPGGQTATALVACARLGHRAIYIGAVGCDDAGKAIERALSKESVDFAAVRREAVPSRVAVVLVDRATGARTILERRDARLTLRHEELDPSIVTSGRILMVDAVDVQASVFAARAARAAGVPTIVDVDLTGPRIDELLHHIDVIVVPGSLLEANGSGSSPGAALLEIENEFFPAITIATLGPEGSLARFEGREIYTPALPVDVVDTTGAGDAFRGGFVAAWLSAGLVPDIELVLRQANAVAGLNCRAIGAQTALPTPTELAGVL
jgi:sugar/nucleoside kinase (ribokinase family)